MPLSHKKSARLVLWLAGEAVDVYMERSRSYSGNVPSNGSVKIGGLWKRSQGLSRFTRPNYRHRVFILTENALSYYSGTVDVSMHLLCRRVCVSGLHARSELGKLASKYNSAVNFVRSFSLRCCFSVASGSAEGTSGSGRDHCSRIRAGVCVQPSPHLPGPSLTLSLSV